MRFINLTNFFTNIFHVSAEVLACDWSKYDRNVIATGGVDGRVRAWDLRNTSAPCFELIVSHN